MGFTGNGYTHLFQLKTHAHIHVRVYIVAFNIPLSHADDRYNDATNKFVS